MPSPHDCHHHATHTHDGHQHKIQRLWIALALMGSLASVELAVGYWGHSLALMAESGHMASDGVAMGVALLAAWLAQRPANSLLPVRQVESIAALLNGLGLVMIAGWIGWEAIMRLQTPSDEIASIPMLMTALVGLGINSLNAALLHQDSHQDLNLRGAFLHVLADAIGSVGVLGAAIGVAALHWLWADGAISLVVAGLILLSAIPLIYDSWHQIAVNASESHSDIR